MGLGEACCRAWPSIWPLPAPPELEFKALGSKLTELSKLANNGNEVMFGGYS